MECDLPGQDGRGGFRGAGQARDPPLRKADRAGALDHLYSPVRVLEGRRLSKGAARITNRRSAAETPTDEPRDRRLFELASAAARDAIEIVRSVQNGDGFILDYTEYPHLSWFDSGFPHLSTFMSQKVPRYRDTYRRSSGESQRVSFGELSSFKALQDYCLEAEPIGTRLSVGHPTADFREKWIRISADLFAEQLMERFLHLHSAEDPTDALILPLYLPLEAPTIEDVLAFDVVVPAVLTHFDEVEDVKITDRLSLRRLSDAEHLARWPLGPRTTESVNDLVLSAATHAFVWADYEVSADEWAQRHSNAITPIPWHEIDVAFDALRVVTGFRTGYAQVIFDPKGWVEDYTADLPPLIRGPLVRRYPETLENWGWVRKAPSVTRDHLSGVADTLRVVSADSQLQMAARRFSASLLRSEEDDSIVDLCTCLEILLTDDTKSEVLHKLRLRAAAVCAHQSPGANARVIFQWVAKVYALRSYLLHGSKSKKAKAKDYLRGIRSGSDELRTVDVARWIAQSVLQWTIAQGHLVPADEIDKELILDALTQHPTEQSARGS